MIDKESLERQSRVAPETEMSKAWKALSSVCSARVEYTKKDTKERLQERYVKDKEKPSEAELERQANLVTSIVDIKNDTDYEMLLNLGLFNETKGNIAIPWLKIQETPGDLDSKYIIYSFNTTLSLPDTWVEVKNYGIATLKQREPLRIKESNLDTLQMNSLAGAIKRSEVVY